MARTGLWDGWGQAKALSGQGTRRRKRAKGCPLFCLECGTSCLEIRKIFKSSLSPKLVSSAEASPFSPNPHGSCVLCPVSSSSLIPEPQKRGRRSSVQIRSLSLHVSLLGPSRAQSPFSADLLVFSAHHPPTPTPRPQGGGSRLPRLPE